MKNKFPVLLVSLFLFSACDSDEDDDVNVERNNGIPPVIVNDSATAKSAGVEVGGIKMVRYQNIIQNIAASADHKKLTAAINITPLSGTLKGSGPYTFFAATDEAFNSLPKTTAEGLMKRENQAALISILNIHLVLGAITSNDLSDGRKLKTIKGDELTVNKKDGKLTLKDAKGNIANITIADAFSSNGVIFIIDKVLMPK